MIRLSVLDQSPIRSGGTAADAIGETVELAQVAERLGYCRYWLAEHHSHGAFAGTSPEVLIGQIAATTKTIRVGSGGVMLSHYSALKVAESFRVLETIYPGRIDLGLGRAPGADRLTSAALAPEQSGFRYDDFPQKVSDLRGWIEGSLPEDHPFARISAMPTGKTTPEMWLLGTSDQSAILAAHFGCAFSFRAFHQYLWQRPGDGNVPQGFSTFGKMQRACGKPRGFCDLRTDRRRGPLPCCQQAFGYAQESPWRRRRRTHTGGGARLPVDKYGTRFRSRHRQQNYRRESWAG